MKKGFTLVELLAVIAIIGIVSLIAVPTIIDNIEESREKLYKIQVENIELAAKKWATDSIDELDSEYLNSSFIPVDMLKGLEYLPKDTLKNPKTGNIMNGCVVVSYDTEGKTYKYTYDDTDSGCMNRYNNNDVVKGYYYDYNQDNDTWIKNTSKQKESIYRFLVGVDNQNVVVAGSGLYDMGDRYVFRGSDVSNNYVKIGGQTFRIISLDKTTKSLKLVSEKDNGSRAWGSSSDGNLSFNNSTLYTENLSTISTYDSIINNNIKWNIGKLQSTENLNKIKAYESKTQIVSKIGLISMSEYMEASLNQDCSNGILTSCSNDNYLTLNDAWTSTTTDSSVVYIKSNEEKTAAIGFEYETDFVNAQHNIYRTINVVSSEKIGSGLQSDRFVITTETE